jgi:hypothetical protein
VGIVVLDWPMAVHAAVTLTRVTPLTPHIILVVTQRQVGVIIALTLKVGRQKTREKYVGIATSQSR